MLSMGVIRIGAVLLMMVPGARSASVEFNRDVRPILSDKCFHCHGPDNSQRKSKLRLDQEAGAKTAIVPGDPAKSELIKRITSVNKAIHMPPVYSGRTLSDKEIDTLTRWVSEGAVWQKHWAFIPPKRQPGQTIDSLVSARLEKEGLTRSPQADKTTLIRRVSLDLTGLPPSPAEIDAYLADSSPNAYEKVVDRLLASPRYGERMAIRWLDAARYADTNGYQTDAERIMWRWRDWVIDAFNKNKRFDQFTLEQLAGDQLPNATREQRIATGFNRNHRGNSEGGIIPEEYLAEYAIDRVETLSTVWLGLTLGCTRCHDHKYDPFTQKEFYQLFAFFDSIPERGRYFKYGNTPPLIPAPTPDQEARLRSLDGRLAAAEQRFAQVERDWRSAQASWEKSAEAARAGQWSLPWQLAHQHPQAESFDGKRATDEGNKGEFNFFSKFTLSARVYATAGTGMILSRTSEVPESSGYSLALRNGKIQGNFIQRWLDDALRVETEESLPLNEWHHVVLRYDGSRMAEGIAIFVDGKPWKLKVLLDDLNQDFHTKDPLRIGGGGFTGRIEQVRVYADSLSTGQIAVLADESTIGEIATHASRTPAQTDKLNWFYLENVAAPSIRDAWRERERLRKERQALVESFPSVMVMQDTERPKETFVLIRGNYDRPGARVERRLPAALYSHPEQTLDRLSLARWIVDPSNPLTARVTVNRFWQMLFGVGLVKTVEDFGSQGEWPSNPELLDWLAVEFVETGWNVKALMKTIVMSDTYRQSSKVTPGLMERDPENRLLARGPRMRLPAEVLRDQALTISGLLVEKVGGPSVKPYQPAGLWKELSGGTDYQRDHGESLYRRSLYTFWKRTSPPPGMMTFDSAGRETCTVRENRTNTPLQALTLMNDVTYAEAARKLAERMMLEGGTDAASRLKYGFRLATARWPGENERRVLERSYNYHRDRYQTDPKAAQQFLSEGESPRNPGLNPNELAAFATVASMLLNLDETVTKE